jgi:hypothetical protein
MGRRRSHGRRTQVLDMPGSAIPVAVLEIEVAKQDRLTTELQKPSNY